MAKNARECPLYFKRFCKIHTFPESACNAITPEIQQDAGKRDTARCSAGLEKRELEDEMERPRGRS
jgi:hypothetical protein